MLLAYCFFVFVLHDGKLQLRAVVDNMPTAYYASRAAHGFYVRFQDLKEIVEFYSPELSKRQRLRDVLGKP